MCGVQSRPTFHETSEKKHAGLDINLFIHLSFRPRRWLNMSLCCFMQEATLQNENALLVPYHYYREPDNIWYCLHIGYLAYSFRSQNSTLPRQDEKKVIYLTRFSKMRRNVHVLCSCRKQSLPYCWLQMIYNWANNSLTSKGYELNVHTWLHAAFTLISKQVHLLMTANAVNTVQFNVNGTDPYMAKVYLHIGLLQLGFVYATLVCVEYCLSCACLCKRILLRFVLPITKSLV